MGVSKTSDHIQIKIKMPNPSQEPPDPTKAPNQNFKDMAVLCTFKKKLESQNLVHECIKDQWPCPNQDPDAKPWPGTCNILQSPKARLRRHGCSLHLQNRGGKLKFRSWVYQRLVTISKSIWRCQTPIRNSSILQSPKWWLKGHGCSLHLKNQVKEPIFWSWVYQRPVTISKSRSRCQTPVRNLQHPPKPQMRTYRTGMLSA